VRFAFLALLGLAGIAQAGAVGPDDPVITLNGFCPGGAPAARNSSDSCKTIITRAQLESLTETLQPGMSPELRGKVATAYPRLLRMAAAAEQRGLDKTPAFAQELQYARLQLLSQDLSRVLRQEDDQVSAADIKDYYQKNRASFDQATVARIFVPASSKATPATDMPRVAGVPGTSPKTTLEDLRRSSLPPSHEAVFDLAPGQVSEVISDPGGGHFIYKMIHRQTLPLEEATPEIRKLLADERYKEALQGFSAGTTLNDAYFASDAAARPRHHERQAGAPNQN
jgi:PPIC-type PPIASE domain